MKTITSLKAWHTTIWQKTVNGELSKPSTYILFFVSKPASYDASILYFIQTLPSCTCPNKDIQYICYTDTFSDFTHRYSHLVFLSYLNNND